MSKYTPTSRINRRIYPSTVLMDILTGVSGTLFLIAIPFILFTVPLVLAVFVWFLFQHPIYFVGILIVMALLELGLRQR